MEQFNYVIIGGGLAANAAALAIREHDTNGRVIIFTDETHRPYDRVPLSKKYLMGMTDKIPYLRQIRYYEQRGVEIRTDCRVEHIDTDNRQVKCSDGTTVPFDRLLLSTGGRVRRLNVPGSDLKGICYLRTIEDADQIRNLAGTSSRAIVVGGGFIGCEVAFALATLGVEVYLAEISPYLLHQVLNKDAADWIAKRLKDSGVQILTNTEVTEFSGSDSLRQVTFKNGKKLDCDLAVIGIGIIPNTELAESAGLHVENGIWVNEYLETSVSGIYAAGDVAYYYSPLYGENLRVEHWDSAIQQGRKAGFNMAGKREPYDILPYFFSDFADINIIGIGKIRGWDHCIRLGEPGHPNGFAHLFLDYGKLIGVLGLGIQESVLEVAESIIRSGQVIDRPGSLNVEGEIFEAWSQGKNVTST